MNKKRGEYEVQNVSARRRRTLLNDEKEISKRTLTTLLKVQQMGVRIMLASGRPTLRFAAIGQET